VLPGKFNEHLPHVHFSPTRTHVFNEILYDTGFVRGKGTFELRPESNNPVTPARNLTGFMPVDQMPEPYYLGARLGV